MKSGNNRKRSWEMEQILRFAAVHGFRAEQTGPREVIIEIPAIDRSGKSFIVCQPVRTMDEARSALGY
jgi:hypothetical protein